MEQEMEIEWKLGLHRCLGIMVVSYIKVMQDFVSSVPITPLGTV